MTVAEPPSATTVAPRTHQHATLATKVAWSGGVTALLAVGSFGASIIVARMLGAEAMGQLAFLLWMVESVALVAQLGLTSAITRFTAEARDLRLAAWLAWRALGLTLLGTLGFVTLLPLMSRTALDPVLFAAGTTLFVCRGVDTISRAWLAGIQDYRTLARVNLMSAVLWLPAVAIGALWAGLAGALFGYALAAAVSCYPLVRNLLRVPPRAPADSRVRRFAAWVWLSAIISAFVWSRMEIVFLERWTNAAEVGYFAVALRLTGVATMIPMMLGTAFLPHFAEAFGAEDQKTVRTGYAAGTRFLALLAFPMCLGLAAVAPVAVPFVYGEEFLPAVPHTRVLSLCACLSFVAVGSALIHGAGRPQVLVKWGAVGAVLMVGLLLAFVPTSGALGASWARLTVQLFISAVSMIYIARVLRIPVPLASLARIFLAALGCGVVGAAVVSLSTSPFILLAAVPAGALAYFLGLRVLGAVDLDDREAFHRFAERTRLPLKRLIRLLGPQR